MGHLLYLLLLCSVLISCTDVHFFSTEQDLTDQHNVKRDLTSTFIIEKKQTVINNNIDFSPTSEKQYKQLVQDPSPIQVPKPVLTPEKQYIYVSPPNEKHVVFNKHLEFSSLIHNDLSSVNVSPPPPIIFNIKTSSEGTSYVGASQSLKLDSISVLDIPTPAQNIGKPVKVKETTYEKKQNTDIKDLPVVKAQELPAITLPELSFSVEANEPDKVFIPRPLDILFVIDTSESMHDNLVVFRKKFSRFLNYLTPLDWKIAITNADHGETGFFLFNLGALKGKAMRLEKDGKILNLKYLNPNVPDYRDIFLDSISRHSLGTYKKYEYDPEGKWEDVGYCDLPPGCQSLQEQPVKSLKAALGKNLDFFRKEADFIAIVISNSKERANDQKAATQPIEVIDKFQFIHGIKKRFKVYGIIITENDQECLNQNILQQFLFPEGGFSEKIQQLSQMTGGEVFSICSKNYQSLGQSIFDSFVKGWE